MDWATSGGVKIERAKEHIRNLEAEIVAYRQRRPYEVVAEENPDTGGSRWRLHITERIDPRWGAIAGDAIHNLRSPLDMLWRHVARSKDTNRRGGLQIHESQQAFETIHGREAHGRMKPAMDILKAIKPYKGGNTLLWMLHCLDIADKHRLLIPVLTASTLREVGLLGIVSVGMRGDPKPVEEGAILFSTGPNLVPGGAPAHVNVNPQFTFSIAFGGVESVQGQPIIPTLDQVASMVDGIIEAFDRAGLLT